MLLFIGHASFSQARYGEISKAGQDDKLLSYGFFLAGHTNTFRLRYSDAFLDPSTGLGGDIESIVPVYSAGFSLGFLGILRLHDQLNLMFTPKIGFYEFVTDVNFMGDVGTAIEPSGRRETFVAEATMVELPLLFKYKAQRFNNSRMFFTAGGSYIFRTKDQEEADFEGLVSTGRDITLDLGVGFDMYFKFFKFSPEIRFSHGLFNLYKPETTDPRFRDLISDIRRKSITLYLHFQ
ncbi:outer membrane beta-barrel protein [Cecembia lonarensis]|uniref:type IX secretion/gliding motility protein PorT/SprT n=1 Tax=Cecembia lonarensis TaxID=645110 RepID=UPI0002D72A09|nr:outer membrane beta-barrel protein [Cecembia lonarensis]